MSDSIRKLGSGSTLKDLNPSEVFQLPNVQAEGANTFVIQHMFNQASVIQITYRAVVASGSGTLRNPSDFPQKSFDTSRENFENKFGRVFPKIPQQYSEAVNGFARMSVSSLLGGIGYFYGTSITEDDAAKSKNSLSAVMGSQIEETSSRPLLTATPSRSFFPRGFYWDEGFHQLIIGLWDADLR